MSSQINFVFLKFLIDKKYIIKHFKLILNKNIVIFKISQFKNITNKKHHNIIKFE